MKSLFFPKKIIIFLSCAFLSSISLQAVQQIKVPLGCSWGDDPSKLDELTHAGGLTLVNSETVPSTQKKIVTVRGVIGNALKQNIFVFQKEQLVEIEYQYRNTTWDEKKYQEFFDNFRRLFENKYGPGMLLTKAGNGVLAEPAAGDEKQGVGGAQQRSVYGNTRAASTDTTQLVAPAVGLCKKSNVKNNSSGITTAITGYEWTQSFCVLDLFYYTAERGEQKYRLVSVHYKAP